MFSFPSWDKNQFDFFLTKLKILSEVALPYGTSNNARISFGRAMYFFPPFASTISDILHHISSVISLSRSNSSKFSSWYTLNSVSNACFSSSEKILGNFSAVNYTDE